jgi:starvation-inducible DNA-binding protein
MGISASWPSIVHPSIQRRQKEKSKICRSATKESNLLTPPISPAKAQAQVAEELRHLLADTFALYLKTKNFHWHMSGPHFRDYHLLLDEQADQIFAITDDIAERARKIGETTLHSISEISKYQRLKDNNEPFVAPKLMLAELHQDNLQLVEYMRNTHEITSAVNDVATTSLLENWIDEAERRAWFLFETIRQLKSRE